MGRDRKSVWEEIFGICDTWPCLQRSCGINYLHLHQCALSPSFLCVSSFVSFCCAVTFSTVKPLPDFSFSDSLLMTEPSSLSDLLQVTIATGKAVSFPEAGLTARLCHPIPFNNLTFFSLHLSSSCPVNVMHYYWLLNFHIEKMCGHY